MNEIHRYKAVKLLTAAGNQISYDPHGPEVVLASAFDSALAREAQLKADREDDDNTFNNSIERLQQRLTAADERWDELVSAVRSINYGSAHKITVPGDDEPQYRQRKEWIDWVLGLCDAPKASAAATCTWSEGGFSWNTGCGKEWQFTDGGLPSENGMKFCHSCGKTLVVEGEGDDA